MKKSLCFLFVFSCLLMLSASTRPGNMHPFGNEVDVPLPAGKWNCRIYDFDGKLLKEFTRAEKLLKLGKLPIGYYRIELENGPKKDLLSAGVIPAPDSTAVPATSPLAVDGALFYVFFLAKHGNLKINYTIPDVMSMLKLASVGFSRERIMWSAFENFTGKDVVSSLNKEYRAAGIPVMTSLYGTPKRLEWPKKYTKLGHHKPSFSLRYFYNYLRKLNADGSYAAIETWNEPEGIGGDLLGFEIAAYQRTAAIASRPGMISLMGMGLPHSAENLTKNGFNTNQNAYCIHTHYPNLAVGAERVREYQKITGDLPLWLTEASSGSFPCDPARPTEIAPDQARKQAFDIPKLYACWLNAGAEKVFYFFLFNHTEVKGRHFGLLRQRDLMARPGFNTLAVLGQVLAEYRSIQKLNLPAAEGYRITTKYHGRPAEVTLVWNNGAKGRFAVPAGTTAIFDSIGRPVKAQNGTIALSDNPVYLVVPKKMKLSPAPRIARPFAKKLLPVAGLVHLPDQQKTPSGDFIQLPVSEKISLPFTMYNFHSKALKGTVTVSVSGKKLLTKSVELPANGERIIPLDFMLTNDGVGDLVIHSDFGKNGAFDQVISYRTYRKKLRKGDRQTPIPHCGDPKAWKGYIINGSSVKFYKENGWTVFDYDYKDAANRVIGHVWGSPVLKLNTADFPEYRPDAITLEVKLLDGAPVQSIGVNLVENDGATYIGMFNLSEAELRRGAEVVLPLSVMVNPGFRKHDSNGVLDIEKLVSLEIPMWAAPNVKMRLGVRNLRWINYNSKGGIKMNLKRTMKSIAAGAILTAGSLHGDVITNKPVPLQNADFTKVTEKGLPAAWGISNGKNLIVKIEKNNKGNPFVTLKAEKPVGWASIYQPSVNVRSFFPSLAKGQKYELVLEFRAKTANISNYAFGALDLRNEKAQRLIYKDGPNLKGSGDWKKQTVVWQLEKIPEKAKFVLISFYLHGTGSLSVDDVKLSLRTIGKK